MSEFTHYTRLNEEEVEKEIRELSPLQSRMFDAARREGKNRRHSLFIAKSYSSGETTNSNCESGT